jgi:phosphopentomutase
MMARAFILLLDSFGIGATADAAQFGDKGANTLLHIAEHCAKGLADKVNCRKGPLQLPHLSRLGLMHALEHSHGSELPMIDKVSKVTGAYSFAAERSSGKDTPSGHWEIAGVPVLFEWGYFPSAYPSFPDSLINDLIRLGNLPGVLGNKHASGTDIITELGEEHIKSGRPIVYTSADSVFQIAAHETAFGLQRLYDLCDITRKLVDPYHIGRVIARPFLGEPGNFYRTGNRRDIATPPPSPTLLDKLVAAGKEVFAVGKVADIFAHRGVSQTIKANGNQELFEKLLYCAKHAPSQSLTFVNFVDFDMLYGHRRDVTGYAAALEKLDAQLPQFEQLLQTDDIAILTADHGCDPTCPGSDHTREHIPVLLFGPKIKPVFLGKRETFADIGQSIAEHLGIAPLENGESFLRLAR